MKERPILFNGPMVRAILEGRKTQTRRVCKHQPHETANMVWWPDGHGTDTGTWGGAPGCYLKLCPYGQPGDRLWVRETFIQGWPCRDDGTPDQYDEDGNEKPIRTWYRATDPNLSWTDDDGWTVERTPWKPSIHMPRLASRILLEITDVRVERLQEISEADCIAEGTPGGHSAIPGYAYSATPVEHYRHIWESINGHGSWDTNPWVWVIELNRVKGGAA